MVYMEWIDGWLKKWMDGWMDERLSFFCLDTLSEYILTFVNQGRKTLDRPSENQIVFFWDTGALDNVFK